MRDLTKLYHTHKASVHACYGHSIHKAVSLATPRITEERKYCASGRLRKVTWQQVIRLCDYSVANIHQGHPLIKPVSGRKARSGEA